MLISQAFNWAQAQLKGKSSSIDLDAEILLSFSINKYKAFLYAHPEYKLNLKELNKFRKIIKRRAQGEPIAYLIGYKEFYGLNFIVNKHVLIPRPETEPLVDEVLKNKKIKTVADIGTGSGCIAVALANNNPQLKIYAGDISARALKIAQHNSRLNQTNRRIIFKKGDLLKPFKKIKFDALVANLPYLGIKNKNLLNSSDSIGLKFEPTRALYAGPDGLDVYRRLFKQIKQLKYMPRFIYLEIEPSQIKNLKKIVEASLPLNKITPKKDLAGQNRLVVVSLLKPR